MNTDPKLKKLAEEIAVKHAGLHKPSYYSVPFVPHEWVLDAIAEALQTNHTVTLTGHELLEALEFINPDGEDEPDQLEETLTLGIVKHESDDGGVSTGLCCWNDDSDGVYPLGDELKGHYQKIEGS